MSLTDHTAYTELKKALEKAGIPISPAQVLQRSYLLNNPQGSNSCQLAGKITALQYTERNGLEIFISSPYLGVQRIRNIVWAGTKWRARTERGSPAVEFELV
jgi:hypothetical protein